jgi:hypothetical protein
LEEATRFAKEKTENVNAYMIAMLFYVLGQ